MDTGVNWKVADISLADEGARRVDWARSRMPVLSHLCEMAQETKPLTGMVVAGCLHVTKETAVLIETLEQAEQATEAGADIVLLDNMTIEELSKAVKLINGRTQIEASGGITLKNIREVAKTGVNYISVGAITHSAKTVDISMEIVS